MPVERSLSPVLLRWMMLGEWRARPTRVVVAVLAIAIGVALGLAVHLVNRSALTEFAHAIQTVSGDADLQVHATTAAGFDEALYPQLFRAPGVAAASPVVELNAALGADRRQTFTLLGLDVLRAARVTPSLLGQATGGPAQGPGRGGGQAAFDADAIFLSRALMEEARLSVGRTVEVVANGRAHTFTVAGLLPGAGEGRRLAVIDIADAQWRFGRLGRLERIDLRLASGTNRAAAETAIRQALPANAEVVTARSEQRRTDNLSRAYRVNLEMLAMVALLTGGFLVYSAQSLSVARRAPQFALLRVLGQRPRGMLLQVLVEGLILGVLGGLLGVALGTALADLALKLFGGDLGGGYFQGERPALQFDPIGAGVIFLLGLAVALGGSLFPAREAARTPAAVALKAAGGDVGDPRAAPAVWPSLALLAAGAAAAFAPPVAGLPILGYASIALLLAGGVAAMPWLARLLLQPLRGLEQPPAPVALAISRLWGAPRQAAIALCGIVASTSLTVAMAVMVTSFRGSVDDWLTQVLPSDLYLRVTGAASAGLDPASQARIRATPGVAAVDFRQTASIRLSPDRPPVALVARSLSPADAGRRLSLIGRTALPPPGLTPVWISEPTARLYHHRVGDRFTLPLGAGPGAPVFVAGVWRDYTRQFGAVAMDGADYTRLTGDTLRNEAAVDLGPGATAALVGPRLKQAVSPATASAIDIAEPRQLRAVALTIFDRSFAVTYALEAIAIIVGLTGVAATFSAQTLARRREFGMLRHVGVLRGQVVAMLAAEGALLGAVGAVAGAALGTAMSQVLIHVVNPQSFNWTMDTRLPWPLFAGLAVALTATSALTAMLAGRSAVSDAAVQAVREDW